MFNFKDSFSYIWPTISKYKWQFYGIFLLYAARPLLSNTVVPIFYKKIVDLVANTNIDRHVLADSLFHYVAFIAFTFIIANVLVRFGQFMLSEFQSNVMRDLDNLAFSKLQNHSYLFFADNFSGSLVNKTKKFVKSFESMHDMAIDNFWNPLVAFVAIFIVFFIQSPPIAYVFLGIYSIYVFIAVFLSKRKIRYYIEKADADSRITGYLADALTNILSTKSSSASMREIDRFGEATEEVHFLRLRAWNFSNRQLIVQSVLTVSVQIICLFLAVELWISGKITAGMFVLIQSYSITIGNYFWDLGRALVKFTEASSDMKEMVDIFKRTPDVLDLPRPEKCRIKDGEKVGLVGHSGGGKSTITKLLMRFVDITSGEILIDGQDIRKITQDNLRKHISYISQEPILFHRSIRDNIAYSKPNASEGEIIDVAKKAHAHEFISKLPHGYDTLVGERGIKLSGGERQRVAIARAMLKDSPILMLDEATSSLDSVSESYIQDAFTELMKGKTTIVIAHRLSTIQKMDRIIVLDKGKIVEEGTHKEL